MHNLWTAIFFNKTFKPRLHDTTGCPPVVKPFWQLVVSCLQTFNRLSSPFDNRFDKRLKKRLYRVYSRLYNPVWQPGLTTGWMNSSCSFNHSFNMVERTVAVRLTVGCQTGCQTGLYSPVWQPGCYHPFWQPVGCLFTRYSRLSNQLYNQIDNRLYRVNGVLELYFLQVRWSDAQLALHWRVWGAFCIHNWTVVVVDLLTVMSYNQWKMTNWSVVNQTKPTVSISSTCHT